MVKLKVGPRGHEELGLRLDPPNGFYESPEHFVRTTPAAPLPDEEMADRLAAALRWMATERGNVSMTFDRLIAGLVESGAAILAAPLPDEELAAREAAWNDALTGDHVAHRGNHESYACGFSGPHCWACHEPWPCRTIRDEDHDGPPVLLDALRIERTALDVARVKQAVTNVAIRHGLVKDPPAPSWSLMRLYGYTTTPANMDAEIAAEYARLAPATGEEVIERLDRPGNRANGTRAALAAKDAER